MRSHSLYFVCSVKTFSIFKEMIWLALCRPALQASRLVRQRVGPLNTRLLSHVQSAYFVSALLACLNVAGNELEGPFPALYCNVTEPTFIIVECGGVLEADCGCCNCTSTSSDPALWYEGQAVPCTFLRADFDFLDQYNVSDIFFDY